MPQADGHTSYLRRIALELANGGWYFFKINPNNYAHSEPQRATVLKTKSDIIIEDFGKDLETITFSGTTGWARDAQGRTGADRMRILRSYIRDYASQGGNGNRSVNELTFHNFTDGESYIVHLAPDAISLERDVEQPILYNYKLSLVVIRDAGTPPDREVVDPNIGNNVPSIGGDTENTNSNSREAINQRVMSTGQIIGASALASFSGNGENGVVNPRGTVGAYKYGVDEIKQQIGYGEG